MNANDLLDLIGEAEETYVLSAQAHREPKAPVKRFPAKKWILIAAVVALMALLLGCAVVLMRMQDLKIAEETGLRRFDEQGQRIEPTEVTQDVISIRGYPGSPNHLATREWYEFLQTYDPDYALLTDDNEPGIPEDYLYPYFCYTWEMVDKVDEITEKYGLKLLSAETVVQRWQIQVMFEALGIDGVCHEEAAARVTNGSGYFYPEGNFKYDFELLLPQENDNWPWEIWTTLYYTRKDYFDPDYICVDTEIFDQWNYTTSDGSEILIAMCNWGGFFFAEQENAYITVSLNTNAMLSADEIRRPTRHDMELAAEVIDFSMAPLTPDMSDMEEKLAQKEYEAKQAESPISYATYADYIQEKYIDNADRLAGTPYVRSHYALRDLNGDGVEELLLGNAEDHFRDVLTIKDGKVESIWFWSHMNLCENNVILITGYSGLTGQGVSFGYYKLETDRLTMLACLYYDEETAVWSKQESETEEPTEITEAEANAIRSQYPLLDIQMNPIRDFPMN